MRSNEKIIERNALARDLLVHHDISVQRSLNTANSFMSELYGKDWEDGREAAEDDTSHYANPEARITIAEHDGEKWVRVQALGEDFVLSLHDLTDEDGEVIHDNSYDNIMKRLKEINSDTFNRKQAMIIGIYLDTINDLLVAAGGEAFKTEWYTTNELYIPREKRSCADYNTNYSWYFSGMIGCILYGHRYYGTFRCRPAREYSEINKKQQ